MTVWNTNGQVIHEIRAAFLPAGSDAFLLYDSFGFPLELTQEMAAQRGITVSSGRGKRDRGVSL
jgi:alanyl-tRNA synthetase